jgi:hypothetical protein
MTPPDGERHPGVSKVIAMYERGDFDKIDEMVRLWTAIQNVGLLGGLVKRFIIWSGIIAAAYFAASGHITEWIRGIK